MTIASGYSDIVAELKRFNFEVQELNPEDTVSEQVGFVAVKDGITIRYDGQLYVENEPLHTPHGVFDINSGDDVTWFLTYFDQIVATLRKAKT